MGQGYSARTRHSVGSESAPAEDDPLSGIIRHEESGSTDSDSTLSSSPAWDRTMDLRELGELVCGCNKTHRFHERAASLERLAKHAASAGWRLEVLGTEEERSELISGICKLVRDPAVPESARTAGLELIGWLARRKTCERPHDLGVAEARESHARIRAVRSKLR